MRGSGAGGWGSPRPAPTRPAHRPPRRAHPRVRPSDVRPGVEVLSEFHFEFFLAPGAEALIAPYRPPVPGAPQPEPPARIIGCELLELTGRSLDSVLHV